MESQNPPLVNNEKIHDPSLAQPEIKGGQEEKWTTVEKKLPTLDINIAHDSFGHASKQFVRKTFQTGPYKLTGTMKPCEACMRAKAKQKKVPKETASRSSTPGERLYFDVSGPYPKSIGGNT